MAFDCSSSPQSTAPSWSSAAWSGSHAHGWSPIASHYIEVTLKPGESRDFVFLLGYIENEQEEKFEKPSSGISNELLFSV